MTDRMAEEGTGIRENPHGIGLFYDDDGDVITTEQAQDLFLDEQIIAVPNAGAGSYKAVFASLGYQEVKPIEWGSSAGDWIFAIRDGDSWWIAFQSNRYPYHGFTYSRGEFCFDSYEAACEFAFSE